MCTVMRSGTPSFYTSVVIANICMYSNRCYNYCSSIGRIYRYVYGEFIVVFDIDNVRRTVSTLMSKFKATLDQIEYALLPLTHMVVRDSAIHLLSFAFH